VVDVVGLEAVGPVVVVVVLSFPAAVQVLLGKVITVVQRLMGTTPPVVAEVGLALLVIPPKVVDSVLLGVLAVWALTTQLRVQA
jgi:hypothetical protein